MPLPKPLTREDIERAMRNTLSNKAGARFLGVSQPHFRKYAKLYIDEESGKNLFELHKNQCGKGIPKYLKGKKEPPLLDIIEGRKDSSLFKPERIKWRLIAEGYIEEKCNECGFRERRVLDYKIPLLLHFKDKNKRNYRKENIELLCYNCYFLYRGNVLTEKQIKGVENHQVVNQSEFNWELSDYDLERLKDLGLPEEIDDKDFNKYISRI